MRKRLEMAVFKALEEATRERRLVVRPTRGAGMSPSHVIAPGTAESHGARGLISALNQHRLLQGWATRGRVRDELEKLDIRRSHTSDAPVWILVTLLAVAAGSATIGALTH